MHVNKYSNVCECTVFVIVKLCYVTVMRVKIIKVMYKGQMLCTAAHYFTLPGWSTGVRAWREALTVSKHMFLSLPLSSAVSSLHPYIQHFQFCFPSNKHTGWECRLESGIVCNERHAVQNPVMTCFSSACLESISLSSSPWPLHFSWSITSHPSSTFSLSAVAEGGWFTLCVLIFTHLCIYQHFTKSVFWNSLSPSVYMFLSHSLLFIMHTVKPHRMDKCGSMVKQIPEAPQRAKINHFSSSLSSAFSLPLCLCSSLFLLPALLLEASSSSSLSFECHSTLPSYSNILLLIKNKVPSLSKPCALPPPFFLESTDAYPFPPFAVCVSLKHARLFDWQQLDCQRWGSQGRTGLGGRKWMKDTRRIEKWGIEEDISNSKRHAVFPWQPGFHRNGLAKDAISVKKCLHTLYGTVCTQIYVPVPDACAHSRTVLLTDTPEVSSNSSITGHLFW